MSEGGAQPSAVTIEFQGIPKGQLAQVWGRLQAGEPLNEAEQLLARSMADHPHWFPYFQAVGLFEQGDERYPGDVDPFLHVNLHMVIALQLNRGRPKIAPRYYQARLERGEEPHEIIHQMLELFKRQLVQNLTQDPSGGGRVNLAGYQKSLRALMKLPRGRLWSRLGFSAPPPLHPEASLPIEL